MIGTYTRLGVSVWESNIKVIKAAQKKLCIEHRYSREARERRHAFYRQMLEYHKKEQELCNYWRM